MHSFHVALPVVLTLRRAASCLLWRSVAEREPPCDCPAVTDEEAVAAVAAYEAATAAGLAGGVAHQAAAATEAATASGALRGVCCAQ